MSPPPPPPRVSAAGGIPRHAPQPGSPLPPPCRRYQYPTVGEPRPPARAASRPRALTRTRRHRPPATRYTATAPTTSPPDLPHPSHRRHAHQPPNVRLARRGAHDQTAAVARAASVVATVTARPRHKPLGRQRPTDDGVRPRAYANALSPPPPTTTTVFGTRASTPANPPSPRHPPPFAPAAPPCRVPVRTPPPNRRKAASLPNGVVCTHNRLPTARRPVRRPQGDRHQALAARQPLAPTDATAAADTATATALTTAPTTAPAAAPNATHTDANRHVQTPCCCPSGRLPLPQPTPLPQPRHTAQPQQPRQLPGAPHRKKEEKTHNRQQRACRCRPPSAVAAAAHSPTAVTTAVAATAAAAAVPQSPPLSPRRHRHTVTVTVAVAEAVDRRYHGRRRRARAAAATATTARRRCRQCHRCRRCCRQCHRCRRYRHRRHRYRHRRRRCCRGRHRRRRGSQPPPLPQVQPSPLPHDGGSRRPTHVLDTASHADDQGGQGREARSAAGARQRAGRATHAGSERSGRFGDRAPGWGRGGVQQLRPVARDSRSRQVAPLFFGTWRVLTPRGIFFFPEPARGSHTGGRWPNEGSARLLPASIQDPDWLQIAQIDTKPRGSAP